jgi:hypothetical protein
MVARTVSADLLAGGDALARVGAVIESTPADAVVRLRFAGPIPAGLDARALRRMSGARNVTIAGFVPTHRAVPADAGRAAGGSSPRREHTGPYAPAGDSAPGAGVARCDTVLFEPVEPS